MPRPPQVTESHLRRSCIIYCRQSMLRQVEDNIGSTDIQRELVHVAEDWGWSRDRIKLAEGDLGVSGSIANLRAEFHNIIEQTCRDEVGAVIVYDDTRTSRNDPDWNRFKEAAARHDVLYAVGRNIFDFNDPVSNLTSSLLHATSVFRSETLTRDLRDARIHKARKGWAPSNIPVGYLRVRGVIVDDKEKRMEGAIVKDDDEQVRAFIELVLDKIFELRSLRALVRFLVAAGIRAPRRRGKRLIWVTPTYSIVGLILRSDFYAGIYTYSKSKADPTRPPLRNGRSRRRPARPNELIRLEHSHEPYIGLAQWAELQRLLRSNRMQRNEATPVGRGEALVQGRVRCTLHGITVLTKYPYREKTVDGHVVRSAAYRCHRPLDPTPSNCISIRARRLDVIVERELLKALALPSLEMLQTVARQAAREYEALSRAREAERHRADQRVAELERALSDIDDRHVHRRKYLAERSEEALKQRDTLIQEHERNPLVPPVTADDARLKELRNLLPSVESAWRHPSVTPEQRKHIFRQAVRMIHATRHSDHLEIEIEWAGGARTRITVPTVRTIKTIVEKGYDNGENYAQLSQQLIEVGALTGKGLRPFTPAAVKKMVTRLRLQVAFDEEAAQFIHRRLSESARYQQIADELNEQGLRHRLGKWTRSRVIQVSKRLRKGAIYSLEPLPWSPRRRLADVARDSAIKDIASQSAQPAVVAQTANALGVLTPGGRPWTASGMARTLMSLGLHSPKPRPRHRAQVTEPSQDDVERVARQPSATADVPTVRDAGPSKVAREQEGDSLRPHERDIVPPAREQDTP